MNDEQRPLVDFEPVVHFLEKIGGDAIAEGAGIPTDWARYYRQKNLLLIKDKWEQHCKERGIRDPKSVAPKILIPLIENASLEDDETLQDMWAQLLATGTSGQDIHPSFVDITKQLCKEEAQIINHFSTFVEYNKELLGVIFWAESEGAIHEIFDSECANIGITNRYDLRLYRNNLYRNNLIDDGGLTRKQLDSFPEFKGPGALYFTPFGLKYIEACGLIELPEIV